LLSYKMIRIAKQKLRDINDPELNKQGVSIFTIWQYKFVIYMMYSIFLLAFFNVGTAGVILVNHIQY